MQRTSRAALLVLSLAVAGTATLAAQDAPAPRPTSAAVQDTTVDLNTASKEQLAALPGVGPELADKIIAGRPYKSVDDFMSKNVIPASAAGKLKGKLTVSGGAAPMPRP